MKNLVIILFALAALFGCQQPKDGEGEFGHAQLNAVISKMTDIMMHDVTNPPLATRFFTYTTLAGYEVVAQNKRAVKSMFGVLKDYPQLKKPDTLAGYHYQLAALLAMMETAKKMQPSGKLLEAYQQQFLDSCRQAGFSEETLENSRRYALAVSKQILAYARGDRYNRIANFARYTPEQKDGAWYPTPPAYMAAVEPHFMTIRSMTLDTCSQFKPEPPVAFSTDKNSAFYKMMWQNYTDTLTDEKRMIAAYWDCNPFAVQDNGHLLVGLKKISPGAHWLSIAGTACRQKDKSFDETLQVLKTVSIGLLDGFISCWDEKYRSNRIRPETAIRNTIDPAWTPLLQTPPFPEYLSGHSTISAASATILTHFFGKNFKFTDSTEMRFGLGARSFTSFHHAAQEAAISRFYGGIHFMDAIDNGYKQGESVGQWVLQKLVHRDANAVAGTKQ
ncbi:vanadium-dependent haloperoxidase [Flavisolibacter sp. BT320]|nr:vanadium-dependent haloperoxidase [Flavisolibacter longurius]